MQSVFRVLPSICGVRFLRRSHPWPSKPFCPEDHPFDGLPPAPPLDVVAGQPEPEAALPARPGGVLPEPDLPHKSCPIWE